MATYKESKEAFVSHTTGSSLTHINLISTVSLSSIVLYFAIQSRFHFFSSGNTSNWARLALEIALLVTPVLLSITLAADTPLIFSLSILLPAMVVSVLPPKPADSTTSRTSTPRVPPSAAPPSVAPISIAPLPSLTIYRAHMMLLTVLSILAVDFPAFPRSLAKCESFGVSLMDLGVGSFVFSQGVVSAIPLLKNPFHLSAAMVPKIISTSKKVIPVFILGLVRVVLVKGTEYPEHVSEYGVHWNFFFTLALLPPFAVLLHPIIANVPVPLVGLALTGSQHILLKTTSLQDWALGDERVGLLGQNKEGIVSFIGYLAIHMLGLSIGTLILPPSPSHFRRRQKAQQQKKTRVKVPLPPESEYKASTNPNDSSNPTYVNNERVMIPANTPRQLDKTAIELCAYVVVWWTLFGFAKWSGNKRDDVSRRLANTSYVLWVTAFNSLFLLGYITIEILFSPPKGDSDPTFIPPQTQPVSLTPGSSPRPTRTLSAESSPLRRSLSNLKLTAMGQQEKRRLSSDDQHANGDTSISTRTSEEEEAGEIMLHKFTGPVVVYPPLKAPALLEAINLNGLFIFLIANLATGIVNISMQTMYASDQVAMAVLLAYASAMCAVAWAFRNTKIWKI